MQQQQKSRMRLKYLPAIAAVMAAAVLLASSTTIPPANAQPSVTLAISQVPLTVSTPAHPQVLIALGNSESMDGTLSGAIMIGSGSVPSGLASLKNSSSPVTYFVPAGFTPPIQAADLAGNAPYTVSQNGNLADNGASRLNVAKGGIQAIIQAYMQNTDFALLNYSTNNTRIYTTWVYYMSPATSGFTFTNTQVSGNRYVTNPCFGYPSASATVQNNCASIIGSSLYSASAVANSQYMQIGASSDDATINDVLYAGSQASVYINYGNISPSTPFPPNYSLGNYNSGSINVSYQFSAPSANQSTGPTNAGYVPFSRQVMYVQRGFGYGGGQSATSGNVVVPMTSAGAAPTTTTVTAAVSAFLPYLAPETNNTNTAEIKAVAGQAPTAGLLAKAQSYLASVAGSTIACIPKQYVVLISDGLPTQDLAGRYWPPLGSAAAVGYGVTANFNSDGSLNTANPGNDQALIDTITNLTNMNAAGISTYVIGLGAGVDPAVNPQAAATLQAMAIAGGTANYYPASSPGDLVNDLNTILVSVQKGTQSTTAAAVNSPSLQNGTVVEYQASFNPNDTPYQDWTGSIIPTALDKNGIPTTISPWGGATTQSLLDTQVIGTGWSTGRVVATTNPALNSGGNGVPYQWVNLSPAQQLLMQPNDNLGQSRLQYIRGNTALEKRNGGTFRNRSHILGDIVDSQPLYVGTPNAAYLTTSYLAFQQAQAARQPMLYAGANDGMLHAFDATTGAEKFAFIPNAVLPNLQALTIPIYNQNHLFFVDGSPQSGDVQFPDTTWHTILVGGEGGGGKSIYALDITNPQSLTTEAALAAKVLWEFTDADMGLSYSEPQIAPITATPNFAVFFGNGYNSPNNKAVLYAINPSTGQTIAKIDLCAAVSGACNSMLAQGLSTVSVGNADGLQSQPVTQVYAGDLQGNLWAIDVSNATPSKWQVRLLFQARDASGNIQPITVAPVVTLHPNYPRLQGQFILFGTGQLLTVADLSDQLKQTIYAIWDKPGNTTVPPRSNLQVQTLTVGAGGLLFDTSTPIDWTKKLGWYDDLLVAGQRVVTAPGLLDGAFITTLNTPPAANTCNAGFTATFLELNFKTGGAFSQPQLDTNGDGVINALDSNAVGLPLGTGYSSTPIPIGPNSKNQIIKLITQSGGQQKSIRDPNNTPRRLTWWQLQ